MSDIGSTLDMLSYLRDESDFYPWKVALEHVAFIEKLIDADEDRAKFNGHIQSLLSTTVQKVYIIIFCESFFLRKKPSPSSLQIVGKKSSPPSFVYDYWFPTKIYEIFGDCVNIEPTLRISSLNFCARFSPLKKTLRPLFYFKSREKKYCNESRFCFDNYATLISARILVPRATYLSNIKLQRTSSCRRQTTTTWILAWDNYATLLSTKATSSQYQFSTTTIS